MKYITIILILFQICSTSAQSLSEFQWKNRLFIILTKTEKDTSCQAQLMYLKKDFKGMEERKFIVFTLTPNYQITGLDSELKLKPGLSYQELSSKNEDFEIVLIGLDGSIKLRQNRPLTHQELFAFVDKMPMRRQELEKHH